MIIKKQHTCAACKLKKDSFFKNLNIDELNTIDCNRKLMMFEKGEKIFEEGNKPMDYLCLSKGKAKMVKQINKKKQKVIDLKKPVEALGFEALFAKKKYEYSAIALEKSQVCSIDRNDLFKVIEGNAELSLKIMSYLNEQVNNNTNRFLAYNTKNIDSRMAYLLLTLMDFFGKDDEGQINVKLSRAEIADLSNMDTSNSIRTLSKFASQGIVKLIKKDIYIIDKIRLKKLAIVCS